jgi:hypothetical protein
LRWASTRSLRLADRVDRIDESQTLAQLETALAQDQVAVFLALGGGWGEATPPAKSAPETAAR